MEVIKFNKQSYQKTVKVASEYIQDGLVVICPTDTVYGLIADAVNKKAAESLFKIKKRVFQKPVPIFVKDLKMAKKLAKINGAQEKFLKQNWPGAVTAILNRKKGVKIYGVNKDAVGLRIPDHKLILGLIDKTGVPLIGTSANIAGLPASTKIKEVIRQFQKEKLRPDLIIDAGNLPKNKPSVVLDLRLSPPKVLRK